MASYYYRGISDDGISLTGTLIAENEYAALQTLNERGIRPVALRLEKKRELRKRNTKIKRRDILQYLRQLSVLLSAGMPLLDTLVNLSRNNSTILDERTSLIASDLRTGKKFSDALAARIPELPSYVPSMIVLGEHTGNLPGVLSDAADRLDYELKLTREIQSALTYPAVLACVGGVVIFILFAFVIPRFSDLIDQNAANVPAYSRMVIASGVWLNKNLLAVVIAVPAAIAILPVLSRWRGWSTSSFIETLPYFSQLLNYSRLATWSRTMAIGLDNGAEMLTALRLAEEATQSDSLRAQFKIMTRDVRSGQPLEIAYQNNVAMSDSSVVDLIETGRRSGQLSQMLLIISDQYEEKVRTANQRITSIAEPLAIVFLSVIVGALVLAIVLAMTSLYAIDI